MREWFYCNYDYPFYFLNSINFLNLGYVDMTTKIYGKELFSCKNDFLEQNFGNKA